MPRVNYKLEEVSSTGETRIEFVLGIIGDRVGAPNHQVLTHSGGFAVGDQELNSIPFMRKA